MSYRWTWDGGGSPTFDTQQACEDWMGGEWSTLLASGVTVATLEGDGERIYAMKLTED